MTEDCSISLRTTIYSIGVRLVELSGMLGGMQAYAKKPVETLIGIHALRELRELHVGLAIALERFEETYPDEVRRSRRINDYRANHPAPEA